MKGDKLLNAVFIEGVNKEDTIAHLLLSSRRDAYWKSPCDEKI
jgi:hypothetical protein